MGGPGFELFRFKDDHSPVYDHDDPAWIDPPDGRRRTVYRFVVRSVPNPFLECLDGADPNLNVPVRNETITALQALALLNDPFMISQAEGVRRPPAQGEPRHRPCRSTPPTVSRLVGRLSRTNVRRSRPTPRHTAWRTPAGCCST